MRASENLNPGQPPPPAEKSLNQQPADPRKRIYVLKHQAPLKMGTPYHQGGNNQVQNIPPERRLFAPVGPKWAKKEIIERLKPKHPALDKQYGIGTNATEEGANFRDLHQLGLLSRFPPARKQQPPGAIKRKKPYRDDRRPTRDQKKTRPMQKGAPAQKIYQKI